MITMAICQRMIHDFLYQTDDYKEGYSDRDLEIGIQYCKDYLADRVKKEPFHKYDLQKFIDWAEAKMRSNK